MTRIRIASKQSENLWRRCQGEWIDQVAHFLLKYWFLLNRAVILLDECLLYIEESLEHCVLTGPSDEPSLKNLDSLLNSSILHQSLKRKVADLRKNVKGASVELTSIQKMTTVISETYQSNLVETIQTSNHQISEIQKNLDKSTAHVAILQTLFGGYFVMQIFDRIFGLQYNMIDSKGASLIPSYMDSLRKILVIPGIVIILTFCLWFVVHHAGFKRYFRSLTKNSLVKYNWVLRYDLNVPISQQKLKEMLAYKYVDREVLERDDEGHVRKRVIQENSLVLMY